MKTISLELSDELAAGLERVAELAGRSIEEAADRMFEIYLPLELERLDLDAVKKDEVYQRWYLRGQLSAHLPSSLRDQKEKIELEMENGFFRKCAKLQIRCEEMKDSPRTHFRDLDP